MTFGTAETKPMLYAVAVTNTIKNEFNKKIQPIRKKS